MQTLNDTLKTLTEAGLEIASDLVDVPIAGTIGATLVNLFWPDSNDVWSQVQGDVATMLGQALNQETYNQLSLLLSGPPGSTGEGLVGAFNEYLGSLQSGKSSTIQANWAAAHQLFTADIGQFQQSGPFVALFVQVANLQLALLKDGVCNGISWGWKQPYVDQIHQELKQAIYQNANWVAKAYQSGLAPLSTLPPGVGGSSTAATLWQQQNSYIRTMVLTAFDFVFLWPYFDPDAQGPPPKNTREIYGDLVGGVTNNPIGQPMDTGTAPLLPTLPAPTLTTNYNPSQSPQPPNYHSSAPISLQWGQPPAQPAIASVTTWVTDTPNNADSPWVYTLYSTQVSRAGAPNPDPITGAQPPLGASSTWSTVPITSARGGSAGGTAPYVNWIQFVSNNDPACVSPVAGNIYGSNYVETWAGPQPFVFTFPSQQLSNVIITQVTQVPPDMPMPVAVIFGFRFSNSY